MKILSRIILLVNIVCLLTISGSGQQTMRYKDPEADYYLALELYNKEKFGAAQELFNTLAISIPDQESELKANTEFYRAMCASELYHTNAQYLLEDFVKSYPQNTRIQRAYFELGDIYYRNKDYKDALKVFENIDRSQLKTNELAEYYFKKGYCYLKTGNNTKAQRTFEEIIDKESRYRGPANYYYAHIAYLEKDYQTALDGFLKLTEDETFGSVVPYYIIQIYYMEGQYDNVISFAENESLLSKNNSKRGDEIAMMVGDAYFQTGNFEKSVPYIEQYTKNSRHKVTRDGWYQLGYAYYMISDFEKAISALQKTTSPKDSLAQNAFYIIADCYIKTDQKQFAQNAFLSAFKIDDDLSIKEDALFNYAKLAYELSYDPYNEAIKALRQYITDYPDSKRLDEAYTYLMNLFMSTNNFKEALTSIENIKTKDEALKTAYQKIAHYRAIEIFNTKDYFEALKLFKRSLDYSYDQTIHASNLYWIAESYYRLSSYDLAADYYKKFLNRSGSYDLEFYELANYNLGYIYFSQKNYSMAKSYFRKFTGSGYPDALFMGDAHIRTGDCYFIEKNYDEAINQYDRAVLKGEADIDYALFQKSVAYGGKGNFSQKATLLRDFITRYPRSAYIDDAVYELATTYLILNRDEEALTYFKKIIDDYPTSKHVKNAFLKSGLIYYSNDNNELAISTLKSVIERYPGSVESKEALESLQNIYVDMNRVDEYFEYASTLSFADVSVNEQDSLSYFASENKYMEGDCDNASSGFENYINRFPRGAFLINANYYKAECDLKRGDVESAIKGYRYVINYPSSRFTENALVKGSAIEFDLNNIDTALIYFELLEKTASNNSNIHVAQIGQMRCNFLLGQYSKAIQDANTILQADRLEEDLAVEAHYTIAKSALSSENYDLAIDQFRKTCELSQGEWAAESQLSIAAILFDRGDYALAEEETFKLINTYPSFDYYVARGFILLADIYYKTDNNFQAKQTLMSIIENYEGHGLVQIAQNKLDAIIEQERLEAESLLQEADDEEIDEDDF